MPRFFFHVCDGVERRDEEGVELPSASDALKRAAAAIRKSAAESVIDGRLPFNYRIEVENDKGAHVGTVRFHDVVEITF